MPTSSRHLGVVAGVDREAHCLDGISQTDGEIAIALSGASALRAAQAARALIRDGAAALLSFGLAGGLHPNHGPGAVIVADRVLAWQGSLPRPERRGVTQLLNERFNLRGSTDPAPVEVPDFAVAEYHTSADLSAALVEGAGMGATLATIVGVNQPVMTVEEKYMLLAHTQAAAADMESHAVAAEADAAGLPFAVLRVVSDPSNRNMAASALAGVKADGAIAPDRILRALLARPWEILSLVTLAAESGFALSKLRRVGRRSLPLLISRL